MKVYISGKMTGIKNYNKEKFSNAEKELKKHGIEVINPSSLSEIVFEKCKNLNKEPTREDFMREDIKALCECDMVYMLDDWRDSIGARHEHLVANEILNIPIIYSINELNSVNSC